MERLTNKYADLLHTIKEELLTLLVGENDRILVTYAEFPWLPYDHFTIFLVHDIIKDNFKLIKKTWNSDYDNQRFSMGVFNLDRLCINQSEVELSISKQIHINEIISSLKILPLTLDDTGYIVLDGIEYQLTLNLANASMNYEWKVPSKNIIPLQPLINFLQIGSTI